MKVRESWLTVQMISGYLSNTIRLLMLYLALSSAGITLADTFFTQGETEVIASETAPSLILSDIRTKSGDSFTIDLDNGLQEIDQNGNTIFLIPTFSSQPGVSYDGLTTETLGTSRASCVNYSGYLSNGALFECEFCVPTNETLVPFGSENITVPSGGIKFTLGVQKWPFESVNNQLQFITKLILKEGQGENLLDQSSNYERSCLFSLTQTSGVFVFPIYALIDQKQVNITVTRTMQDSSIIFQFNFPYFATLSYDPIATFGELLSNPTLVTSSGLHLRSQFWGGAWAWILVVVVVWSVSWMG